MSSSCSAERMWMSGICETLECTLIAPYEAERGVSDERVIAGVWTPSALGRTDENPAIGSLHENARTGSDTRALQERLRQDCGDRGADFNSFLECCHSIDDYTVI